VKYNNKGEHAMNMISTYMKKIFFVTFVIMLFSIDLIAQERVTDIDGNVYQTVTIGTQVWMKENLKVTKYRNGDSIGTTYPDTLDYFSESAPKYQWAYDGNDSIATIYGRLYTWYAITDSRNVCPNGWHVPTVAEWTTLINFLGGASIAHGKLKETGTTHWQSPNSDATNESGFTGLPGGSHWPEINFDYIRIGGHWWSATSANSYEAWRLMLNYQYMGANTVLSSADKKIGWSVRCLRDTPAGVDDSEKKEQIPDEFNLNQNYPNPFNPTTVISYQLSAFSNVKLSIFNVLGREVATLVNEKKPAGSYTVQWNAAGMPSGIYFYRLQAHQISGGQAGNTISTRKLVLLK
jgi:uncharacterized protein (TIGR02145 family)